MKKKYMILMSLLMTIALSSGVFADDEETLESGGMVQAEAQGQGGYSMDDGTMDSLHSLGGSEYITNEGDIMQLEDMGGGQYQTDSGGMMQVRDSDSSDSLEE